jgi:hypothetical protein
MHPAIGFIARHFWFGERRIREERKAVRRKAERLGMHVYRGNLAWDKYDDFLRAKALAIPGIPDARCAVLQGVIRDLRATPGDVAECGVRFGKSAAFLLEADPAQRIYHLFDSFEGVSAPVEGDVFDDGYKWKKHALAASEDVARKNLARHENVRFYRGWIPSRFHEISDTQFVLLHVDVDLYEPTRDTLDFFWPRLMTGGVVICDDYGARGCPGARRAVDEFLSDKNGRLIELPTCQCLVVKLS